MDIDRQQNVLLPAQHLPYKNVWGIDCSVKVMDIGEICAEKIRAMSDRARYRDFYDLFMILDKHQLDLKEITDLIQQKEIRQSISKTRIMNNWKIISTQQGSESDAVFFTRTVNDQQIEQLIDRLPFQVISSK